MGERSTFGPCPESVVSVELLIISSTEAQMGMDFPIGELMDEDACYAWLLPSLHPGGLACPSCGAADDGGRPVHRRNRAPVLDYKCPSCARVFNAFTRTILAGTHRRPSRIVLFLRGVAPFDCAQGEGDSTAGLARELSASRGHLTLSGVEGHDLRHRLQATHTRVNVELGRAIKRALEINALMPGVRYKRYGHKPGCRLQPVAGGARRSAAR
jgi:transposase-like protein